VKETFAISLNR